MKALALNRGKIDSFLGRPWQNRFGMNSIKNSFGKYHRHRHSIELKESSALSCPMETKKIPKSSRNN